jgi:hypothetical protein
VTSDQWAGAVRRQLGLGRLLPLGGPADGAWLTERAAVSFLRRAAAALPDVRVDSLRLALASPGSRPTPAVPPPPSALAPSPLVLSGDFATTATEPLPDTADRVRAALWSAAEEGLGLVIEAVDLRVTGLLDTWDTPDTGEISPATADATPADERAADVSSFDSGTEARAAEAAARVPGVAGLTGSLGGSGRAIHVSERPAPDAAALPAEHIRVELAVRADHRALVVARAVRAAVGEALAGGPGGRPSVAVVVTSA